MTEEMRGPALVRDDELTEHLRALYAPPGGDSYWAGLEQRILARLAKGADEGRWWALSERTYQIGLLAAGLTLIIAGSVYLRSRTVDARMAYETVIETPGVDTPVFARRGPLDEGRATLRAATGH
jgi:hypothetical protein